MVDAPSLTLAFAAGLVWFLSPCGLPLVPGYLATVSGTKPADLGAPSTGGSSAAASGAGRAGARGPEGDDDALSVAELERAGRA